MGRLENPEQLKATLADLTSVYPFNEYEYIISHLLAADKLTLDEYLELRDGYIHGTDISIGTSSLTSSK